MDGATDHQIDHDAHPTPDHGAHRGATTAPPGTRRPATVLRVLIAAAVVTSGVVHFLVWQDFMRNVDVVGPAFLVNAAGGVVIGVAVLAWRHWLPLLAAIGFGAATFGAYVMSRTVGFFGVHEQVWTTEAVISAGTEIAAIVLGVVALAVERRRAGTRGR